jgi:tetratricopeptide (TPR) repeat protein
LQRAYTLGQQLGETTRLLPLLQALASVHIARGEHRAALDDAERLVALAKKTSQDLYAAMGRRMMGTGHFFLGHCAQARRHLEAGLQAYSALAPEAKASDYALVAEEGVRLHVWLAHAWLVSGYPTQATAYSREARARAQALNYIGAQAIALTTAGVTFHAACRQPQATFHAAEQLLALANQYDLPSYQGWATFYWGWALAHQGKPTAGLPDMRAGLDQLQATGTQGSIPSLLTLLAEVYAQEGETQKGEAAIQRALALADETGARSFLAEMHRVQGMLWLTRSTAEEAGREAKDCFTRAITVAREQGARLWELRATVDLARLWAAQGREAKVRARLSEIYDWFTEGFDTPDLVAAQTLLDTLRSR